MNIRERYAELRAYALQWKTGAEKLSEVRAQDIRNADTIVAIASFDGLFEEAVRRNPSQPSSGLIEFVRRTAPLRKQ